MVRNGSFVPGPFLVGFGGMKVGMSIGDLTLSSKLTVPSSYIDVSLNSFATCANMVQTLCQDVVALCVLPCCADIECNRPKRGRFFLQETMPCIHGPSLCLCMPVSKAQALAGVP